jgi:hypothetical protein
MLRLLLIAASWFSPAESRKDCVSYWQRELGLDEWTITTKVVGDKELGGRILGDIDIDDRSKTAVVRLMRVEDSDLPRWLARAEQRFTIAHELMHLHLYVNRDADWRNEKVVDTATIALMQKNGRRHELMAVERE